MRNRISSADMQFMNDLILGAAARLCEARPDLAKKAAYQAIHADPDILWFLVYMRLNRRVSLPLDITKQLLSKGILSQDDQGVFIAPWVEDLIDDVLALHGEEKLRRLLTHILNEKDAD